MKSRVSDFIISFWFITKWRTTLDGQAARPGVSVVPRPRSVARCSSCKIQLVRGDATVEDDAVDAELREAVTMPVATRVARRDGDGDGDGDVVRQRREQEDEKHERAMAFPGHPHGVGRAAAALTILSATVLRRWLPLVARLARTPGRRRGALPRILVALSVADLPIRPIAEGLEVALWTAAAVGDARLAAPTTTTTSKKVLSPPSFAAASGCSTELLRVVSREEDAKAQEVCRCPMTNSPPQTHTCHTRTTHTNK
jgi:hypothetical protein